MASLQIKWIDDKWTLILDEKSLCSAKTCRGCLVKIATSMANKSGKYKSLEIYDKDGTLHSTRQLGVAQ